mmetsp:Transcript_45944/g.128086  ORF Transcript_45944/g.128086 Transcript_45944/m.128086 type:complete len:281 (-) Transcript_45944:363-1205(-)
MHRSRSVMSNGGLHGRQVTCTGTESLGRSLRTRASAIECYADDHGHLLWCTSASSRRTLRALQIHKALETAREELRHLQLALGENLVLADLPVCEDPDLERALPAVLQSPLAIPQGLAARILQHCGAQDPAPARDSPAPKAHHGVGVHPGAEPTARGQVDRMADHDTHVGAAPCRPETPRRQQRLGLLRRRHDAELRLEFLHLPILEQSPACLSQSELPLRQGETASLLEVDLAARFLQEVAEAAGAQLPTHGTVRRSAASSRHCDEPHKSEAHIVAQES